MKCSLFPQTRPVNLGNPIERSIQEFAEIIREEVGGSSKIVHLDPVQDDPQKRKPDISRAKQVSNHMSFQPNLDCTAPLK